MTPVSTAHEEHPRSYYAATANERTDYPALEDNATADICVVGGGFTGVATALTLAERGYDVVIVEANRIGWGASGRNGGQLIGGFSEGVGRLAGDSRELADLIWTMGWRGHEIILERIARYAIDCDFKFGYVDAAVRRRHMAGIEADFAELGRRGFPHAFRLVDRDEIRALLGTDVYHGGLVNERNGHLHPLNLCLGEARAAAGLGVRIFERSRVTGIEHGRRPAVITDRGRVDADAVVIAGNAYHALEQRRLSGLVFAAGTFIIATEPLGETRARGINPQDLAVCDTNNLLDYFRLSADRRLLFGGRCNYTGREPRSIRATLLPRMLKVYPALRDVRIDYEWGGKIGIVVDRVPVVGRIDGDVYYAQGYSGHGVNVTHLMGEILADAIGGTLERFDVFAHARHVRLPFGQRAGNQLVALGMLYYRLRDSL